MKTKSSTLVFLVASLVQSARARLATARNSVPRAAPSAALKSSLISVSMVTLASASLTARGQDILSGDTRLACEAILCLSSGIRPGECNPSLSRYFGISRRKFSDTIRARLNFLQLCPVASQTPQMQSLVSAISRGAGRCDAQRRLVLRRRCLGSGRRTPRRHQKGLRLLRLIISLSLTPIVFP